MPRVSSHRHPLDELVELVRLLRGPHGCPWDREQTITDLRAYLLEEAHEVAAAIDSEDSQQLSEELGDLLFHVVFISSLVGIDLSQLIRREHAKMVSRHPHVFGDEAPVEDSSTVAKNWEKRKALDLGEGAAASFFSGSPPTLPALTAAYRMTQKVSGVGFDWTSVDDVVTKVREELQEVEASFEESKERSQEEIGDLLFAVANLARHLEIDPEAALAKGNLKFRNRFESMIPLLEQPLGRATMEEMQAAWELTKGSAESPNEKAQGLRVSFPEGKVGTGNGETEA